MRGARINVMNRGDDTPLHLAASHGHRDIVQKVPPPQPLHCHGVPSRPCPAAPCLLPCTRCTPLRVPPPPPRSPRPLPGSSPCWSAFPPCLSAVEGTRSGFTRAVLPAADPVQSGHQCGERTREHPPTLCLLLGTRHSGRGERSTWMQGGVWSTADGVGECAAGAGRRLGV